MSKHTMPQVGTFVHYLLPDGPNKGTARPALVVSESDMGNALNLEVFADREQDGPAYEAGNVWRTLVSHKPEGKPGTWAPIPDPDDKPAAKAKKKEA